MTGSTKPRPPRVHPLIKQSSALLDAFLQSPEWDRLINLQYFDINDSLFCVLGQTGTRNDHAGQIPGDGQVPWYGFTGGRMYVDRFAHEHPKVIRRIGLEIDTVNDAFQCLTPHFAGRSQNQQWEAWITYRIALRDWKAGASQ